MPPASHFSTDELCERWASEVRGLIEELVEAPTPLPANATKEQTVEWNDAYVAWFEDHVRPYRVLAAGQ